MNLRKYIILIITVLLFSCEKNEPNPEPGHVLLVYLAGDSNLSGEVYEKLEAIEKGFQQVDGGRLFVYFDKRNEEPCLLELIREGGSVVRKTVVNYDEHNSASSEVFGEIIRKIMKEAPAKSYGLLLFSHASGWLPEGALGNPTAITRSIGKDGADEMELADFAAAIPDGMFNYIVFEMCYMAGVEVAWELRNKADYILASSAEIVSPGFAGIYPNNITYLMQGDLTGFAGTAFDYFETASGFYRSATFSLIRTKELEKLAEWIQNRYDPEEIYDISGIQHFDRTSYKLFFDFEDHYSKLANTEKEKEELTQLLNDCIIWKASTADFLINYGGFTIDNHSGMTTYIPQSRFPGLNAAWKETAWYRKITGM